jgi:ribose-phosphate pyrophosphokinase
MNSRLKIFGLGESHSLAESVSRSLGLKSSLAHEEIFPDGEMKLRPSETVRGCQVCVVSSLVNTVNRRTSDSLCGLVFFLNTLRDAGARELIACIPYLAYSRSDQRKESLDPVTNRYVAQMLEGAGVNRIITLTVHNPAAFENAYRCRATSLDCHELFSLHFKSNNLNSDPVTVLSPDIGGLKRAEAFQSDLAGTIPRPVDLAFLEKFRKGDQLKGHLLAGEVRERTVIILDDMMSTGATILRAAEICRKNRAQSVFVYATHGVFSKEPERILKSSLIDEIVVTDSNPGLAAPSWKASPKLKILSCAGLISDHLSEIRSDRLASEDLRHSGPEVEQTGVF